MRKVISSLQNSRIKQIVKLKQRRQRDVARETVFEGLRETEYALNNGFIPTELLICSEIMGYDNQDRIMRLLAAQQLDPPIYEVSKAVFSKLAYRESRDGIVTVLPYWETSMAYLPISKRPFYTVIENVEKPGNLGAILRTTDAVGVDGVIVCSDQNSPKIDLFNPNVIRASLGAIFTQPIAITSTEELILWAKRHAINIIVATPDGQKPYTAVNYNRTIAIAAGSEAFGISDELLKAASETAVIPMYGQMDSLNLSVSTAIMHYEANRQREFGTQI